MKRRLLIIMTAFCLGLAVTACGSDSEGTLSENSVYTAQEGNVLQIVNISGVNLYHLNVSFSEGELTDQDILGEDKLKDGAVFSYTIEDMDTLKNAKNLKLSVTGTDKKEVSYDFGTITVIDPSNMTLVLTRDDDGEYMYLK